MTREEQLGFCKRCINRSFSSQKGIICSLTSEKADFEEKCEFFYEDISVPNLTRPVRIQQKSSKTNVDKKPEVLSREEIYMLMAISVVSVLLVRFAIYLFEVINNGFGLFLVSVTFILSLMLALIFRKRERPGFRFLGDIKFKLLFILLTAGLYSFYLGFVFGRFFEYLMLFVVLFLVFFILSFLCVLILKPVLWLFKLVCHPLACRKLAIKQQSSVINSGGND